MNDTQSDLSAAVHHRKPPAGHTDSSNTWVTRCFRLVGGVGLGLSILGFFGQLDWRFDLFSHFRLQYLVGFIILLLLSVYLKRREGIIVSLIGILLNVLPLLPFYLPQPSIGEDPSLSVLSANVRADNTAYPKLIAYIRKTHPDVIVLEEVNPAWRRAVQALHQTYPYTVEAVRNDFSGMLLLSRFPLIHPRIERFGKLRLPNVAAEVPLGKSEITIMGTHPFPPISRESTELRNDQLADVARYADSLKTPTVLVGDFNTSPFSYPYRQIGKVTALRDCVIGFGYQSTWQDRPLVPPFGVSVDHCFHSPEIVILESSVGDAIGSDHRPILNRIALRRTN